MSAAGPAQRLELRLVRLALVLTPIAVWPMGSDLLGLPKALVVLGVAVGLASLLARDLARTRALALPCNPVIVAMGVFVVVALVRAATVGPSYDSLVGADRFHGPVLYLAYGLVALTVQVHARPPWVRDSLRWMALPVTVTMLYALTQAAGLDPIGWSSDVTGVSGTLGNPNYLAAFLAIGLPILLAVVTDSRTPPRLRWTFCGLVLAMLAVLPLANSDQGWAAGGLGVLVFVLVRSRDWPPRWRRPVLPATLAGMVAGVALLLWGMVAGRGPFHFLGAFKALGFRVWSWQGTLDAIREQPVWGVGPGRFTLAFAQVRPPGAFNDAFAPDVAHSVPLDIALSGGVLLLLPYAAMVLATAVAIFKLSRRPSADVPLPLVAGLAGAWAAYQTQSLVSIDVPPMPLLHWVAAALLGAMAWPEVREIALPGGRARRRPKRAPAVAAAAVAVLLGTPVLLQGLADTLTGQGEYAMNDGRAQAALDQVRTAARLAPWRADYVIGQAAILFALGQADEGLRVYTDGVRRWGDNPYVVAGAARAAAQTGERELADQWYARLLELEPRMTWAWQEAACAAERAGDDREAASLRRRARHLVQRDRATGATAGLPGCAELLPAQAP